MAKYQQVYIFTKQTNMLPFVTIKTTQHISSREAYTRCREYYANEREVQLICMFRWERTTKGTKCFCKIKCPINPLPIKGEFETPGTTTPVVNFLRLNGWQFKQKLNPNMFE